MEWRPLLAAGAVIGSICAVMAGKSRNGTLDAVRNRGALICGVNGGLAGFGTSDDKGDWTGFDVDYCKAVAGCNSWRSHQGPIR